MKKKLYLLLVIFGFPTIFIYYLGEVADTPNEAKVLIFWLVSFFVGLFPVLYEYFILGRSKLDWFSPILWPLLLSFTSFTAVTGIINSGWTGKWIQGEANYAELLPIYFTLDIIGKVVYFYGYYSKFGTLLISKLPSLSKPWSEGRIRMALGVSILIGLTGYLAIAMQSGGIVGLLNNMADRRDTLKGENHFYLMTLALPVGLWCYWGFLLNHRRLKIVPIMLLIGVFFLFLSLGGRAASARVLIVGIISYHYLFRRINFKYLIPIAFIGYSGLLIVGELRTETISKGYFDWSRLTDPKEYFEVHIDEDGGSSGEGMQRTMRVIDGVPEEVSFQYFTTYQTILTTFIPRSIFPEKKGLSEAAIYAPLFGSTTNGKYGMYPAGSIGDFWLQAGVLGVILGFFAQGIVQRSFYENLKRNKSPGQVIFYSIALLFGFFNLRNLGIFQTTLYMIPFFIFINYVSKTPKAWKN